ncbi:MAG: hypothetical protein AAGJ94_14745 [Pseudomonadota bacterium]
MQVAAPSATPSVLLPRRRPSSPDRSIAVSFPESDGGEVTSPVALDLPPRRPVEDDGTEPTINIKVGSRSSGDVVALEGPPQAAVPDGGPSANQVDEGAKDQPEGQDAEALVAMASPAAAASDAASLSSSDDSISSENSPSTATGQTQPAQDAALFIPAEPDLEGAPGAEALPDAGATTPKADGEVRPSSSVATMVAAPREVPLGTSTSSPENPMANAEVAIASEEMMDAPVDGGAESQPPFPTELPTLMRLMSALQDDIARGSGSAIAAQRILAQRIAAELDRVPGYALAKPQNARHALTYALTGGGPSVVRAVVDKTAFTPPYDTLMAGALAYLEGRKADALRHFGEADLDGLDQVVRGPAHLALAALKLGDDAEGALNHLAIARHAAPGTLVEEAALRRAVLITSELNAFDDFRTLTGRYLRKFRSSVYAGNFRKRLSAALTRMSFLDDPDGFEKLELVLAPMTEEGRREIFLDLARTAVETGRGAVAAKAARRSQGEFGEQTLDSRRAALYAAAADVVDPRRNEAALLALGTMDVTMLPEADRVLRTAALQLGQAVANIPEPGDPAQLRGGGDGGLAPQSGAAPALATDAERAAIAEAMLPPDEPLEIESRVNDTLSAIDALLESTQ